MKGIKEKEKESERQRYKRNHFSQNYNGPFTLSIKQLLLRPTNEKSCETHYKIKFSPPNILLNLYICSLLQPVIC
jgi:hypothetical protein